jgi:hypothetical protein
VDESGCHAAAGEESVEVATKYKVGVLPAPASAVKKGESALVLGTVDSATITATQVVVQPRGDGGAAAAQAAGVIPFRQGVRGIVDRVVRLSDGEYEVHNISINWPHHVFVGQGFQVLGYE